VVFPSPLSRRSASRICLVLAFSLTPRLQAISSWRFQPASRKGKRSEANGTVEMECQPDQPQTANSGSAAGSFLSTVDGKPSAPAIVYKLASKGPVARPSILISNCHCCLARPRFRFAGDYLEDPEYTEQARQARLNGTVVLSPFKSTNPAMQSIWLF
jgi:hypothetical protein